MALQVKLWVYVTANHGPVTARCRIDVGTSNWGTALTADEADYASTNTILSDELLVDGTGWVSFDINPNDINWAGTLWVRLSDANEGADSTLTINFNAQDATSNQPYLEIIDVADDSPHTLTLTGAGAA